MKVGKRVNPKEFSSQGKIFFSISLMLHLYERMDVPWIYCAHHFMMYVNQIIMLHILHLHSAVRQLYPNKTGREKKETILLQMSVFGSISLQVRHCLLPRLAASTPKVPCLFSCCNKLVASWEHCASEQARTWRIQLGLLLGLLLARRRRATETGK